MLKENLHITPDPEKGFPQPDIPADEAWSNMSELLDTALPVSPPEPPPPPPKLSPSAGGGIFGSSQFWTIVGGVIIFAGALTWSVVSLTDRSEKLTQTHETTDQPLNNTPTDSLISTNLEKSIIPVTSTRTESIKYQDKDKGMIKQGTRMASINNINPTLIINDGTTAKIVLEPATAVTVISGQGGEEPLADVPAQPSTGNIVVPVGDKPAQPVPVNEDVANDTLLSAEPQQQSNAADADSIESNRSSGISENLSWQIGISGNIGEVIQKGRAPNMFYGLMVTGGLWNEKLKGGIEIGLGYEVYNDYGSVADNILIDSIPIDSLGNYQNIDTTRITAYKYQYRYLQVPLLVSKQVLTKGKFSLDIKTGPLLGIVISDKKTLDNTSGPENGEILSTINNDYSRLKISWQWQVMPQIRWNLNERLSLSLSPYCILYLNNLYDKKNRPAVTPFGIGVNGGLIYRFK